MNCTQPCGNSSASRSWSISHWRWRRSTPGTESPSAFARNPGPISRRRTARETKEGVDAFGAHRSDGRALSGAIRCHRRSRAARARRVSRCARARSQIVTEHPTGRLIYNSGYLGVERTDDIVIVQILLSSGRSVAQKQAFYARAVELISKSAAIRPEDVTVVLLENTRADWSFGRGEAQYLT